MSSKRLALVIGSGGAKCVAALGLWKVLCKAGISVDLFVGASGGAIYAACMALGMDLDAIEESTFNLWTGDLMEGYASNLRAAMTGEVRFNEHSGLINDAPIYERLVQTFGTVTFADVKTPLHVVATDLYSGEAVVFSQSSQPSLKIVDALRASIAIPIVFPPWEIDGQLLVDGAASDPFPIDVAIREGAGLILAMGFELPVRSRLRSYNAVTAHFNSLYMNNLLKASFAFHNLAHYAEIIPIVPEFDRAVGTFDRDSMPYAIQLGQEAMNTHLNYVRRLLEQQEGL